LPDTPFFRWRQGIPNHHQADCMCVARLLKRFQVRHRYYFEPDILQNSLSHISQFRVFRDNENGTSWLLWGHNPKVLQKLKAEFDTEHLVNDSGKCWSGVVTE